MKPRLQTSLGQQLVLTPQLRQAIHLLQLSAVEIEQELAAAVESNPLLDWAEPGDRGDAGDTGRSGDEGSATDSGEPDRPADDTWSEREEAWTGPGAPAGDDNPAERVAEPETLHDHLLRQLHLSHLSPRDRLVGVALVTPSTTTATCANHWSRSHRRCCPRYTRPRRRSRPSCIRSSAWIRRASARATW